MKIVVFGAGAWGTALAVSAAVRSRSRQRLHRRDPLGARRGAGRRDARAARERALSARRRDCPTRSTSTPRRCTAGSTRRRARPDHARHPDGRAARACCSVCADIRRPVAWVCKGFEAPAHRRLPRSACCRTKSARRSRRVCAAGALSGPSFAQEVARGQPTALVAASADPAVRERWWQALHGRTCASTPTTTASASRSAARSRTCWRSRPACATACSSA